jgi:hypothetical protein
MKRWMFELAIGIGVVVIAAFAAAVHFFAHFAP